MKDSASRIQVVVRVRPHNRAELADEVNSTNIFQFVGPNACTLKSHHFSFDRVYGPTCGQELIFNERFKEVVDHVLDGFNSSIIAYGQTAAGKSYTMTGARQKESWGIIPRAIERVFANTSQPVQATFVELYNDKFQDLFNSRATVTMQGDGALKNARVVTTTSKQLLLEAISQANGLRAIAATKMNSQSSRSHSILQLRLGSQHSDSKLVLVDLAGSEKVSKTGAVGTHLGEAGNINKSLTVLAMVIQALSSSVAAHVPYRDSKLTQTLRDSIGGTSKTVLVVTCSPAAVHERESFSSLRFGSRAKLVHNKVPDPKELEELCEAQGWQQRLRSELQQWELYGTLPRANWSNLTLITLPKEFELQDVPDPFASLLETAVDKEAEDFECDLTAQRQRVDELRKAIDDIDQELSSLQAVSVAPSGNDSEGQATMHDLTQQLETVHTTLLRKRREHDALARKLSTLKALSSTEKLQKYRASINAKCERYVLMLADTKAAQAIGEGPAMLKRVQPPYEESAKLRRIACDVHMASNHASTPDQPFRPQ